MLLSQHPCRTGRGRGGGWPGGPRNPAGRRV